ncbi:MAG: type IV pilus twitching motility protein PilT [Firmicutes bacterium]|nr:type IV pilus twitching motility protein PilT [Bacillota bacterium]
MNNSKILELIEYARKEGCSDIHLTVDLPPVFRKNGDIIVSDLDFSREDIIEAILSMLDEKQRMKLDKRVDLDFAYTSLKGERQRVNVYYQKNNLCAAIRLLNDKIPSFEELNAPAVMKSLVSEPRGLILVTGPTGSGKSTTLAAMIDYINNNRKCHIITAEEPIEYLHEHKNSIVHQREVGIDVGSFAEALRGALREDPDVILVGEMRDLETISAAVTAAETGHLVLSTLHTTGAANTIDRIIDVFPPHSQAQIRTQLAGVLKGIITQQLVKKADGSGRTAAFEVLIGTDGLLNLIRENKAHQITSVLQTGLSVGMHTLDYSLAQLVRSGTITKEEAMSHSSDKKQLLEYLN